MKDLFEKVFRNEHLTRIEAQQVAEKIFEGQLTDSQIAAFLTALKCNGETAEEMAGIAETIQRKAVTIDCQKENVMDNCGTGGDQSGSFNISTTAAFVLAAGGVSVAKHGNRSISSKSGSADIFECLGVDLALSPDKLSTVLNEVGLVFLFAPHMHPKMKYVMKVRKELGTPTILNLIGPLTNPVLLNSQLMGTYRRDLLEETAKTLGELGRTRAVVANGSGGLDEATLAGTTHFALLEEGMITMHTIEPEEFGFTRLPIEAIRGGNAEQNTKILLAILKNQASPYLDTVLLNAGLGFFSNGKVSTVQEGILLAKDCVASGAAFDKLQQLIQVQKEVA
ncbi:anthranilate phosphoribosyltransferase [Enterococcus haemoperoxidus ATCC BAA-382]|uniref:Anthranilate phosphoribosyltransferase n=1 Tax=Enterococcus haemoperoxidus ATCC BAA-382 TaxID=1158608 RepID=R2SPK4_9ENTE|nr:anthranilate phosphoribosyltransferase [Enterococcus haemoperoxidus]EOH97150.1 anthranilate phosphoribosyltransferase [Enterococcus haemoperoxidus ATCC BAA-382]EOT59963.1 anthranilate phosphoribosyltransferase [Enterococcus haemoperoxidus ATCC BAA-382]OJG56144.1 anthranilate phosphoribosyltransferase [Enterococcus haemoperoxidus]